MKIWPLSKSLRFLGLPISPASNTSTMRTNGSLAYNIADLDIINDISVRHNVLAHLCICQDI